MSTKTVLLAATVALSGVTMAHDIGHEHEHVEGGWNAEAGFVSDVDIEAKLWNPRGKSQEEIDVRAEYLAKFFDLAFQLRDRPFEIKKGLHAGDRLVSIAAAFLT